MTCCSELGPLDVRFLLVTSTAVCMCCSLPHPPAPEEWVLTPAAPEKLPGDPEAQISPAPWPQRQCFGKAASRAGPRTPPLAPEAPLPPNPSIPLSLMGVPEPSRNTPIHCCGHFSFASDLLETRPHEEASHLLGKSESESANRSVVSDSLRPHGL